MERSGRWLFSWRSYLPLAFLGMMLARLITGPATRTDPRESIYWMAGCAAVSAIGLVVRALVVGYAPRRTSGRTTSQPKAARLNTTGMYAIVRHPLYLGNFLIWLGVVATVRDAWLALLFVLLFALYYERIMLAEEAFLWERFGAEFERWAAITPAIVPRPVRWKPAELTFSFRNVLRREYTSLFLLIAAFAGMDSLPTLLAERRLAWSWPWALTLATGLAVYVVLRTLKRHTSLLRVEGR